MSTINEKMTSIADLIRTLIGTTDTMGLDAMATNLTTANTAVASARTAITNKGVSVPSDADVTDLATYIAKIVTGTTGYTVKTGTRTPSSVTTSMSISHGLGKTPAGCFIILNSTFGTTTTNLSGKSRFLAASSLSTYAMVCYCANGYVFGRYTDTYTLSRTSTTISISNITYSTSDTIYLSAAPYTWVAWG